MGKTCVGRSSRRVPAARWNFNDNCREVAQTERHEPQRTLRNTKEDMNYRFPSWYFVSLVLKWFSASCYIRSTRVPEPSPTQDCAHRSDGAQSAQLRGPQRAVRGPAAGPR